MDRAGRYGVQEKYVGLLKAEGGSGAALEVKTKGMLGALGVRADPKTPLAPLALPPHIEAELAKLVDNKAKLETAISNMEDVNLPTADAKLQLVSVEEKLKAIKKLTATATCPDGPIFVGIGTDGASSNMGCNDGLQARLQEAMPHVLGIWCAAHIAQLALTDASKPGKTREVSALIDACLADIASFLHGSTNRMAEYEKVTERMSMVFLLPMKHSDTRWSHKLMQAERMTRIVPVLFVYLVEIVEDHVHKDNAKAVVLLGQLSRLEILMGLFFYADLLHVLAPRVKFFQRSDSIILQRETTVDLLISDLADSFPTVRPNFAVDDENGLRMLAEGRTLAVTADAMRAKAAQNLVISVWNARSAAERLQALAQPQQAQQAMIAGQAAGLALQPMRFGVNGPPVPVAPGLELDVPTINFSNFEKGSHLAKLAGMLKLDEASTRTGMATYSVEFGGKSFTIRPYGSDLGTGVMAFDPDSNEMRVVFFVSAFVKELAAAFRRRFKTDPVIDAFRVLDPAHLYGFQGTESDPIPDVDRTRISLLMTKFAGALGLDPEAAQQGGRANGQVEKQYKKMRDAMKKRAESWKEAGSAERFYRHAAGTQLGWNDFPVIMQLYEILLTIPTQTAICERGFSYTSWIRDRLRSSLGPIMLDAQLSLVEWRKELEKEMKAQNLSKKDAEARLDREVTTLCGRALQIWKQHPDLTNTEYESMMKDGLVIGTDEETLLADALKSVSLDLREIQNDYEAAEANVINMNNTL